VTVQADVHQIPIFVRVGSAIDLGDLRQEWSDAQRIAHERPNLAALERSITSWFAAQATVAR
jgi:alpha-glucosidase (family GH31 glycosyl hydrolase)